MWNFSNIPLAVVAVVLRDCQHFSPTLCGRVSSATAEAVDRNACLDCRALSSSNFLCLYGEPKACVYPPVLEMQSVLTAVASRASVPGEGIFVAFWWVCGGIKFPCLTFLFLLRAGVANSFVYDIFEESQIKAKVEIYIVSFKKSGS